MLIVALQWLVNLGAPIVVSGDTTFFVAMSALFGALAFAIWWIFFSRAPRFERWSAIVLMVIALAVTSRAVHESIRTGAFGFQFFMYAIPVLNLAFIAWAVASRHLAVGPRRTALIATLLAACAALTLVRSNGITGDGVAQLAWRWSENPEERFLAQAHDEPEALPSPPATGAGPADWPGFRGSGRDSVISGVHISTHWSRRPPVELWRRPVGPGWSSFAVGGGLLYTQEQHGDDEVVGCYDTATGEPVWRHRDKARFYESDSGAGPRSTPTLSGGRVYTLGATGILNALDARDGTALWSRDAASDTGAKLPHWGFTSSPLVVDDVVIVHVGDLVAYEIATGEPRWYGPDRDGSHSSPHLATIARVEQVLMLGGTSVISVSPADGTLLWEHSWPGWSVVQPALSGEERDVLIGRVGVTGRAVGIRRITVVHGPDGWTTEERWTSNRLKPFASDFVVHKGHAFGFDGRILACIDVADGERKWKGGRYGSGQLVLLPDQDVLLVVSERGELALVEASADRFTELARFPALEGKTWNHPVLVGDLLLVRNGQEMAAFRLPLVKG